MKSKTDKLKNPKTLKEFVKRYIFSIIFIFFMANIGLLFAIRFFGRAQECYTADIIASDSRCLYIYDGKIYEKGTRDAPHQGHACGNDVTSVLPASHLAHLVTYMDPNYKGDFCTAPSPTPIPSETPIPPSSTPIPDAPTSTQAPQSITSTPVPTVRPLTVSPTPLPVCLPPPAVLNIRIDCPTCSN